MRSYEQAARRLRRGSSTAAGCAGTRSQSDVGMMGGTGAHEFMAPCAAGENEVALAPGYAANVEVASAVAAAGRAAAAPRRAARGADARARPRSTRSPAALGVPAGALIKAMPVVVDDERGCPRPRPRRSPPQRDQARQPPRRRRSGRRGRRRSRPRSARSGSSGRSAPTVRVLKDAAISGAGLVCGANAPDAHLIGVEPGRDFDFTRLDVRDGRGRRHDRRRATGSRSSRRSRSATSSSSAPATRSRSARPTSTPTGNERPIVMGSYGIGPARIVAAAIEQRADERGIVWPPSIAPWQVHIVRARQGRATRSPRRPSGSTRSCARPGSRRSSTTGPSAGTGEKLTDAELLGCPLRLAVGKRGLADGVVEAQVRADGARRSGSRSTGAAGRACGRSLAGLG